MSEIITSEIEISAGVISSGLTVDTNGVVTVLSGGTVTDTEAVNFGYLVVESGGFARDLTMKDGGDVLVLGEAENLTMKDGGQMDVMEGVMRSGTILNDGYGMVYAGASGLNVAVSSGGRYLVYGGYVGDTVVESGGSFTIQMSGGIAADTVVNSGGSARVVSGAHGSRTDVNGGRLEMLYGYLYDTVVSNGGSVEIISGQAYNTDVNSNGTLYVAAAGEAHMAAVVNGGYLNVQSGTIYDANIQIMGSALLQDAAAFRLTLNGGRVQTLSGTVITEADLKAGSLNLGSGTVLIGADINGASVTAEAGTVVSKSMLRHTGTTLDVSSGVTFRRTRITAGTMSVQAGATVEGTTVSDSGILAVRESASVEGTTVNLGGQVVLGGTAHSVILNGSSYLDSSGSAIVSALSSNGGRMQVSGGYAADVQVYGGTLGVSGGVVSGLTMSKGEITIGAGGTVRGAVLRGVAEYSLGGGYIIVFSDATTYLTAGTGGGFTDTAFAGYGGGVPVLSGDTLSVITAADGPILYPSGPSIFDPDGPYYPIFFGGSTVPALGYLTVEAGGLLEDAEASWMRITVSGDGVVRNLSTTNYTLISLAAGGTLTGRMSFAGGSTVTAEAGGIVDFDLTNLAPGNETILNGLNAVTGAPTFTVTVSDVQAAGRYVLAEGAKGFAGTLTVRNTDWAALGTLTVGELTEIGGRYYLAKTKYDTLYLSIWTERPEILPDPNPVYLNTTWTDLAAGTVVALSDGGTATFGYDAFADLNAATDAVAESGLVIVTGCEAALPGLLSGAVDVAAGASVTGGTVGERGTLTLKSGASARDIAISGGTFTAEAGSVLTVTRKFSASGTITVNGIVNLDISGSTGSTDALIDKIANIQGAATYRLTVGENQAAGGYKLVATPNNYEAFTLTVVDASGNELGTVGIRYVQQTDGSYQEIKTNAVINGMRYSIVRPKIIAGTYYFINYETGYTLTVTPETEKPYYLYVDYGWNTLAVGSTVSVTSPDTETSCNATYGIDAFYDLSAAVEFGDENCVISVYGGTFSPAAGVTRDLILTWNTSDLYLVLTSNRPAIILENTTVYRSVTAKSGSLAQNLTVAAGGSVTVSGGTAKSLTVAAGGALTVTDGMLTGSCTFEAGSSITVSGGTMAFDIAGMAAGGPALYDGLAYVTGAPNCMILISADQAQGVYVLGTNAAGFAPYFTIQEKKASGSLYIYTDATGSTPRKPNVITVGETYRVNGTSYTLAEMDGVLTLTVGAYEMPETVYINSTWDDLMFGETVTLQSGATATFGVDAFSSVAAAHAASAEGATAYIDGGTAVLNELNNEKTRKTVALAGSVVRGGTGSTSYIYDLTLEGGATGDALTVNYGTLTVKSGATLTGETKTTSGVTVELYDGAILGGTLSAEGKTVLHDVASLGGSGSVVISTSGTLTGTAVFTEDMDITVNGRIDFDISGTTAGAPMLFRGLSYLKGAPSSYSITVNVAQEMGVYLLADAVDDFGGTITLRTSSGTQLGTIEVGKTVEYLGVCYTLRGLPSDGKYFLSLVVSNERPPVSSVTVNASWRGKQAGETVYILDGTATYLYDAFSNLEDAFLAVGAGGTVDITGGSFTLPAGTYSNPVVVEGATLSLAGTGAGSLTGSVSVIRNGILEIAGEAAASASITVDATATLLMSGPSNAASLIVDGTVEFDITRAGGNAVFEDLSRIQGAPTYAIRADGTLATGTYLVATGASGVGRVELRLGSNKYALSTAGGAAFANGARYDAVLTETGDLVLNISRPEPASVFYFSNQWSQKKDGDIVETIDGTTAYYGYNAFGLYDLSSYSPGATLVVEHGYYGGFDSKPSPQRGVNLILRGTATIDLNFDFTVASGCITSVAANTTLRFHQGYNGVLTVESGATLTVDAGGKLEIEKMVIGAGANITVNGAVLFCISGESAGGDAIISDLSAIRGTPSSFTLGVHKKQDAGKYVLASGAAGFDGVITVTDINYNNIFGTVSVGQSFLLGRKTCTLELDETGDLCLNVVDPVLPATVYLSTEWAGLAEETAVALPEGGTAWIGYDAFSALENAVNGVAEGGTIEVRGGSYNATPVSFGEAACITVRGGVLNMLRGSSGFLKSVTVEAGGTLSGEYTFMDGGSLMVNGGIAAGRARIGNSGTVTVHGGTVSGLFGVRSGATLTVDAGATLSVERSFLPDDYEILWNPSPFYIEDGASVTVNGTILFDAVGLEAGGNALISGLSRIQGAPAYALKIGGREDDGRYVLASDAAGFGSVITVGNASGRTLGAISFEKTVQVGRRMYALDLDENGDLCFVVSSVAASNAIHINSRWSGMDEGTTVSLPDGTPLILGYDAFGDAEALTEVADGGMAFLWDGTFSVNSLGKANTVIVRGGEFKLNGAVGSGKTITVASGGTLSGAITVEAGGAITVEAGGTLSVDQAVLAEGASLFVNGTLNFNLSARNTAVALFTGLSRVQGDASYSLTITGKENLGTYILSMDAGLFYGDVTVCYPGGGAPVGTLTVGGSLVVDDKLYSLSNDGFGNLRVIVSRPDRLYVNADWKGLAAGTAVMMSSGYMGTIGIDAFADAGTAFSVIAPNGTVILEKGEFEEVQMKKKCSVIVLGEVSIYGCTVGSGQTITVGPEGRLNGMFKVKNGGAITVEEGGTLSVYYYNFEGGSIMVRGTFDFNVTRPVTYVSTASGYYSENDTVQGFDRIQGSPALTVTVDISNPVPGRYLLDSGFYRLLADSTFTVVDVSGATLGTLTRDETLEVNGVRYTLQGNTPGGAMASTFIVVSVPKGEVRFPYVNSAWEGLADGTEVTLEFDNKKGVIGVDCFSTLEAALEAIDLSDEPELKIFGGTFTATQPVQGYSLVVLEGAVLDMGEADLNMKHIYVNGTAVNLNPGDATLVVGGTVRNLTLSNGMANLQLSRSSKLTGRITLLGGRAQIRNGANIDFDLSAADEETPLLNDMSFLYSHIAKWPSDVDPYDGPDLNFTLTVDADDAPESGIRICKLAEGAAGFDGTITVVNRIGEELGTITVGGAFSAYGATYRLYLAEDILSLTVTARDNVPPEVINVRADIVVPTNRDVVVTAGFTDDVEMGEAYYRIGEDGAWTRYDSSVVVSENATVYFKAVDAAGNVSEIVPYTVNNIDKVAPTVASVTANAAEPTNRDVVLTAAFEDNMQVNAAYYRIGADGEWLAYDFANGVTISENATVYFKAVDAAGNVSEAVSHTVDNIDRDAPTKPTSLRASVSEHMVVLAWNASEETGSGIGSYIVHYWNGEQEFTVSTDKTNFVIQWLDEADWHWTVYAVDKASNASEVAEGDAFTVTGEAIPEADKRFFLGDFAGDGKPMFAKYAGGIVSVYADNGALWGAVALGDGWEPAGIGDFDGDGKDDVLRINAAGYVVGEMSNGDGTFTAQVLNFKDAAWDILGIGDFDGDGKDDVLVANPTGASETVGLIGYWKGGTEWTLINGYSAAWEMIATGDFDGDGKCDMLWKNSFLGADGKVYNAYCSWIVENPIDWRMVSVANPEEWNFLCAGDFDGDGTGDIAMVNAEGVVGIWGMSDGWLSTWSILSKVDTAEWSLVGVADLNGDGTDDIAWRSAATGIAGYWQINDKKMTDWHTVSTIA